MTFLEAALEILRRERKALHYKDIVQKAVDRKMLTFVGRTPEVTMQSQLLAAVKKAPGNPFVRVKAGVFGLLRYPEGRHEPEPETKPARRGEEAQGGKDTQRDGSSSARREGGSSGGDREGREGRGRRRRRGGRGRGRRGEGGRAEEQKAAAPGAAAGADDEEDMAQDENDDTNQGGSEEPEVAGLSPEDRAAALGSAGLLDEDGDEDEDEDEDEDGEEDEGEGEAAEDNGSVEGSFGRQKQAAAGAGGAEGESAGAEAPGADDEAGEGEEDDEDGDEEGDVAEPAAAGGAMADETGLGGGRRRRRRRRRRRGGEGGFGEMSASAGMGATGAVTAGAAVVATAPEGALSAPEAAGASTSAAPSEPPPESGGSGRRILSPVDAAIEILRGQAPGRGMHVRQLADAAIRRRLVHGEPNEAWRVMRAALAAEPKERLRSGTRPRIRAAGSGLFALSRRPPDMDLERAEHVFGEARRALRERTVASLEQRLGELSPAAFEAVARVLLQREGFGPATFIKRVEGTIYLEALRGRGARPSKCLIGLRPGPSPAGRRAIGELRAGIRARGQDEGLLMLAGRLGEDAISEWRQPGPPLEVADGAALAETCIRHGVGTINAMVSVDFVDADFFAELQEG